MNENQYDKIKEIADEAWQKHETITRADVAYLLKCQDGAELSSTIFRAYEACGRPESIRRTIVTNQENKSVVDSYQLDNALEQGRSSDALSTVHFDLQETQTALKTAEQSTSAALKLQLASDVADLAKYLQGSNGIDEVRGKASALMQNYGKMVDDYQNAEVCVKNDIHDFVELRSAVNSLFMQYACALVDIFGDAIKVVEPSLFNFDEVKWLDVVSLQQHTQLEYNKLDENCTMLLGEIAQNFDKTLNQLPVWMKSSKALGTKGGIYGTLVMGVLSYLNHIVDASEKTTRMQNEYLAFEDSVKRDRFAINSDMLRLSTIHKNLNDIYIPRADAFVRLANGVLNSDLQQLLDSLYTGKVKELKETRDALFARCQQLERSIHDHQENIALFEGQLKDWEGMLVAQKDNYEKATQDRPSSPNMLTKIFTLGIAQRRYEEDYLVWSEKNGSFVSAYEETIADVEEGKSDCQSHKKALEQDKAEYIQCKSELKKISDQIVGAMDAQPERKVEVLKHLKAMVGLLRAAKSVAESRLDDNLLRPQLVPQLDDYVKMPFDVEEKVTNFTKQVCDEAQQKGATISRSILQELGVEGEAEESVQTATNIVQKGARLLDSWTRLQAESIRSQLTDAVYQQEMEKLKTQFQQTMKQLDQKSGELREMLRVANTTVGDNETVRKALMQMAEIPEEQLTEADFEAILRNEKTIIL